MTLCLSLAMLWWQSLPWAEEAFGTGAPDAVNMWLGGERAVTHSRPRPFPCFLVMKAYPLAA